MLIEYLIYWLYDVTLLPFKKAEEIIKRGQKK